MLLYNWWFIFLLIIILGKIFCNLLVLFRIIELLIVVIFKFCVFFICFGVSCVGRMFWFLFGFVLFFVDVLLFFVLFFWIFFLCFLIFCWFFVIFFFSCFCCVFLVFVGVIIKLNIVIMLIIVIKVIVFFLWRFYGFCKNLVNWV